MAAAAAIYPPLKDRPIKDTVLLFDVDETLTKARQVRQLLFWAAVLSKQ
jgi:phosphomannomutase